MLPEYQTFLNAENMDLFWQYVKYFLFFVAPVMMIFIATDLIGTLIDVIKRSIGIKKRDNDDDDVYYY